ncbi:MAG: AmmeMemoRadiSam system protein B [Planctomycetota bacterium]
MTLLPRLRPLEATPAADGTSLRIRDPLGVAGRSPDAETRRRERLDLAPDLWRVARRLDGTRTAADIAADLSAVAEQEVSEEEVLAAVAELSTAGVLEDAESTTRLATARTDFDALPNRPSVGAGRDYPADPTDLRIRIAGLVANDWDMPPPAGLRGLLAPACSIGRAAPLYARSYAALRIVGARFARIVLLAPARAPVSRVLVPLDKDFETPLGAVQVDREALAALGAEAGEDALAHREALALERQMLFLRLLLPNTRVVPLLVGAVSGETERDEAVAALRRVERLPGETFFLAAADLARLLAAADQPDALGPEGRRALRGLDKRMVDLAVECDAEGWRAQAVASGDAARAAESVPVELVLRVLREGGVVRRGVVRGHVLGYHQDLGAEELTTAASMAFLVG